MTTEELVKKLSQTTDRKAILRLIKEATIDNSIKIDDIASGDIGDTYMLKSDYDTDKNGTVDIAELAWESSEAARVNGHTVESDVPSNAVFTDTTYTDLEIKTKYENNPNTNAYTDIEKAKLDGIEENATADLTAPEIKSLYESNANTNVFLDAEKAKLAGIEPLATADQTDEEIKIAYENNFQVLTINSDTILTEEKRSILADTINNNINLTLPNLKDNLIINIKKINEKNILRIITPGNELIENDTEIILNVKNESITLLCDNNNWFII